MLTPLTCAMGEKLIPLFREAYPDITFVTHEQVEAERFYASYGIGLFFDDKDCVFQPCDFRHVGLHRTAGYILGVDPTEVPPHIAHKYAAIVATGRSDFPNQINNVLAFPGIFRGALNARATTITENMKIAAAEAIAGVAANDLRADAIVPSPLDPRVADAVAAAVSEAARRDGVCR